MSRRPRKSLDNKSGMNTNVYIALGIIILAAVVFVLTYIFYGNSLNKQSEVKNVERIASSQNNMLNVIENKESSQVSSSMGKTVNEMSNNVLANEETEKRAVNTSKIEENITNERNEVQVEENQEVVEQTTEVEKDPTFSAPVDGEVIKNYASDSLVYSNTLEEWTVHLGIDYAAEKTSVVKAAADGTVKSIKNDPRYGLTVVIEHSNGFTSMYANLLSTEFISVGENVSKGQTIATVGNTATFEIADETHLHFEILKDGINVDPNLYIK